MNNRLRQYRKITDMYHSTLRKLLRSPVAREYLRREAKIIDETQPGAFERVILNKPYPGEKPLRRDVDHDDYFSVFYRCPRCKEYLESTYNYGRAWTADGLRVDQMMDCPKCGCHIDWSEEPKSKFEAVQFND